MRTNPRTILTTLSLALAVGFGVGAAQKISTDERAEKAERERIANAERQEKRKLLDQVMAKKLGHAHEIMTSLALEDFVRMAVDAGELKRVGEATLMKISPTQEYVKFAVEFSSITEELGRRAKAHDLNGATLSYIRLTMNCVECHRYVRDGNVLGRNP